MKTKSLTLSALGVVLLGAGCTSAPVHRCPLSDKNAGTCSSMQDSYKAAMAKGNTTAGKESVFSGSAAAPAATQVAQPFFTGQATNYPEPGQQGTPVFQQPRVHRVWVAPYVDANGNLRSGEYAYFNTPGQWNYGTMKKPGAGSAVFGPARSDNLGVNVQNTNANIVSGGSAPAVPPSPTAQQTQSNTVQPSGTVNNQPSGNGITQPLQRLN